MYLNNCGYPSGPYKTGPRELNVTSHRPNFVMAWSLTLSVSGMISRGSAYSRIGSETTEDQRSKQVAVASYTTPFEHYDGFYTMPYIDFQSLANQVFKDKYEDNKGSEQNYTHEKNH